MDIGNPSDALELVLGLGKLMLGAIAGLVFFACAVSAVDRHPREKPASKPPRQPK